MSTDKKNNGTTYHELNPKDWENDHITNWIADNKGLLIKTVRSYVKNNTVYFSWEDLLQEVYFCILHAQKTYDPTRNATFNTYACAIVRNHLKQMLRRENAQKKIPPDGNGVLSLNDDTWDRDFEGKIAKSTFTSMDDLLCQKELKQELFEIVNEKCTQDERAIFNMLLESNHTGEEVRQHQMASRLNCSLASISKKFNDLLKKLASGLKDRGLF